jgi:hypothetical protein
VLVALAEHDDYALAADALDMKLSGLYAAVSRARRQFLAHWHEEEQPSRPWESDKCTYSGGPRYHHVTVIARKRARRRRERVLTSAGG